jgi:hypothetical protein
MPTASIPHNEPPSQQSPTQSANRQDMTTAVHAEPRALARTRQRQPVLCPTDADAIVPDSKPKLDKHSLEYVVKSGIAGGLAGCAVRFGILSYNTIAINLYTGKDTSWSSRSRQDPLPNLEPSIRKILRQLERRRICNASHLRARRSSRTLSGTLSDTASNLPLRRNQIPSIRAGARSSHPNTG